MEKGRKAGTSQKKGPCLQDRDRVLVKKPLRLHVVDRDTARAEGPGHNRGNRHREVPDVSVCRDEDDSYKRQQDRDDLEYPRPAFLRDTGHQQNHHRREVLQNGPDPRGR